VNRTEGGGGVNRNYSKWTRDQRAAAADLVRFHHRRMDWADALAAASETVGVPAALLDVWCRANPDDDTEAEMRARRMPLLGDAIESAEEESMATLGVRDRGPGLADVRAVVGELFEDLLRRVEREGLGIDWLRRKIEGPSPDEVAREFVEILSPGLRNRLVGDRRGG